MVPSDWQLRRRLKIKTLRIRKFFFSPKDKFDQATLEKICTQIESVPLFVITKDKNIYLISEFESKNLSSENAKLVYAGNEI